MLENTSLAGLDMAFRLGWKMNKTRMADGLEHEQMAMTLQMKAQRHERSSRVNRSLQRRVWKIDHLSQGAQSPMVTPWEFYDRKKKTKSR